MMKKSLFLILSVILISGCSTAGPFVSNISSDGKGNLIIEKQRIKHDGFSGIISTEDTTTQTIRVISEDKKQ